MRTSFALLALLLSLSLSSLPMWAQAQTPETPLPTDLIYVTKGEDTDFSLSAFVRVNATTLETSLFYIDKTHSLRPLGWSPQENYFAFLRSSELSHYWEVCLLTHEGDLYTCFEDKITGHVFRWRLEHFNVTWSEDERRIYFVADYDLFNWDSELHPADPNKPQTWATRLIEADVQTGKMLRTIYQSQGYEFRLPPFVFWSSDVRYVRTSRPDGTLVLIDRTENREIVLPDKAEGVGALAYCAWFSPHDNYLVAVAFNEDGDLTGLVLVNPQGEVVRVVGPEQLAEVGAARPSCPAWYEDESAFLFVDKIIRGYDVENPHLLLKYSLVSGQLTRIKQLDPPEPSEPDFLVNRPLRQIHPAPNDPRYVAVEFTNRLNYSSIRVLLPDGQWWVVVGERERDGGERSFGMYPVWAARSAP